MAESTFPAEDLGSIPGTHMLPHCHPHLCSQCSRLASEGTKHTYILGTFLFF